MTRIKIEDLPKDMKISKEEMKKVVGGGSITQIQSSLRVSLKQTTSKTTTGASFADIAASGLSKEADLTMSAEQTTSPFVPGGTVLSSAVSG